MGHDDIFIAKIPGKDLVGISTEKTENFQIFPNPANGMVFIKLPEGAKRIIISNSMGQKIQEYKIVNESNFNSWKCHLY